MIKLNLTIKTPRCHASANAATLIEHNRRPACIGQVPRAGQSRHTGAYDPDARNSFHYGTCPLMALVVAQLVT
jgi:hypothetical protein